MNMTYTNITYTNKVNFQSYGSVSLHDCGSGVTHIEEQIYVFSNNHCYKILRHG